MGLPFRNQKIKILPAFLEMAKKSGYFASRKRKDGGKYAALARKLKEGIWKNSTNYRLNSNAIRLHNRYVTDPKGVHAPIQCAA